MSPDSPAITFPPDLPVSQRREDIERAIRSLAETGEMAILLVEQYYDFAESLADQYLLMERGEFIMRGRGETMPQDGVREALAV